MACYYPLDGWQASSVNPSGKRSVVFNLSQGRSDLPISVPCGKCVGCRADQSLVWAIRGYHELQQHDRASFLTLTYDDEHLPADGKISKRELQLFIKRLRKKYDIRYIACGEYGEQTRRPHYHAIIYGEDFLNKKIEINSQLYTNNALTEIWKNGHVTVSLVNFATICYVCGYVNKKLGDGDTFSLVSRRPGIGHDWLRRFHTDIEKTGMVTIEGREFPVPKRYIEWMPENFQNVIEKRKKFIDGRDAFEYRGSLRNREINKRSVLTQKQEKL